MPEAPSGRERARALYERIRDGSFPPDEFSHAEHIRLAWYYLTEWPLPEAMDRFERDFRGYVARIGAQAKYHHTITRGLLELLATHLDDPALRRDWDAFREDARPAFDNALALLKRYWSEDTLFSDAARRGWVDPDRAPLPRR